MNRLVFLPVFKVQLEFQVKHGRRWTAIEHLILWTLSQEKRTVEELATITAAPSRMIVESLINLMRAGWVEVQASRTQLYFAATSMGIEAVSAKEELDYDFDFIKRFRTFCLERLASTVLRPENLRLMHYQKVNELAASQNGIILEPSVFKAKLQPTDIMDRLILETDDQFERWLDDRVVAANLYAVLRIIGTTIEGLPPYADWKLEEAIFAALRESPIAEEIPAELARSTKRLSDGAQFRVAAIREDDLIVGGDHHFREILRTFETANSYVIMHSTFLSETAVSRLLPAIESAAKRDIDIDILWGERDGVNKREKNTSALQAKRIDTHIRNLGLEHRVRISSEPTESHSKLLLADTGDNGSYVAILGSCNWLSSLYEAAEISVRISDQMLVRDVANAFATLCMPASGRWDRSVMRLIRIGEKCRVSQRPGKATAGAMLIFDDDHYAAVRDARDNANEFIVAGCDWLGTAAETSVFVPMRTAAKDGITSIRLLYQRSDDEFEPTVEGLRTDLKADGIDLVQSAGLHGKFLVWDSDNAVVSSFNWLSTATRGYRYGASEIGVLINAPGLGRSLLSKLADLGCPTASKELVE